MSGTVGLTAVGQMLDFALADVDTAFRRRIFKFIQKLIGITRKLRARVGDDIGVEVFRLLCDRYRDIAEERFESVAEAHGHNGELILGLLDKYIVGLCVYTFTPDTRTQLALAKRRGMADRTEANAADGGSAAGSN
jgi:hypothetical protein